MSAIQTGIFTFVIFLIIVAAFGLLGTFFPKQDRGWKDFFKSDFKG